MNILNETSIIKDSGCNLQGQQAADKYKMLLDAIDEGYCIIKMLYDEDGKANNWLYLEVNRAFELNNGLSNALGKTILETTPDIEPKWFEQYDSVARTGIPKRFREDSIAFNRVFNLYVFRVGQPKDRTVTVIFTDITEQAKAEEKLKASEEKQAFLLKLSDSIRFMANPVDIQFCAAGILGAYLGANRAGYAETLPEEGKVAVMLHYTKDVKGIEGTYYYKDYGFDVVEKMTAGNTIIRNDIANDPFSSDAEKRAYTLLDANATLNVPLVKDGKLVATMFVHFRSAHFWTGHEITLVQETAERTWAAVERAKTEEALKESETRYREQLQKEVIERTAELKENRDLLQATLDSSLDMIQVFKAVRDDKGEITDFTWILNNDVAANIYGDVINKSLLQNNPGVKNEGIFDHFVQVTEVGIPMRYEKHYVHEQFDGWFHQSVVKLEDGVATSTSDITERKLAEKAVIELNRLLISKNRELETINSELATLNNIAANDYNETFRALYLNLENLIKSDAARLSNTGKANLRKAQSAIQKMKMLTEDIVSFSKLSFIDSASAKISLQEVLEASLEDHREKISFSNAQIVADKLPDIEGYPLLVSLLFHHILDNSLKFRDDDEFPLIKIKSSLVYRAMLEDNTKTAYHEITFSDNGISFPQEEAENIFSIFYRLHERGKYKGSGIGLAVCRKIMALHDGYISAKPIGKGTVITCLFPA